MKALILNSGTGSRMGELTKKAPKCMVSLTPELTILDLQLQNLISCGIREVLITTGPFEDILKKHLQKRNSELDITFVHNPEYQVTNYIYSIALASDFLMDSDILLIHGDLVFEKELLAAILRQSCSCAAVDFRAPLPEKDFKAVIENGKIKKIGVEFFEQAVAAQPLYHFLQKDWLCWLKQIRAFCRQNNRKVYAENALNEISDQIDLYPFDIHQWICMEVDNPEDLNKVQELWKRGILKL